MIASLINYLVIHVTFFSIKYFNIDKPEFSPGVIVVVTGFGGGRNVNRGLLAIDADVEDDPPDKVFASDMAASSCVKATDS